MGLSLARTGDPTFGVCTQHDPPIETGGMVLTGSGNVIANGFGACRFGDIILSYCNHTGMVITCSGNVMINGAGAGRASDYFSGQYSGTILLGSGNVFSG